MKLTILFVLTVLLFSTAAYSQDDTKQDDKKQNDKSKSINDIVSSQVSMNNVMGTLVNGIKTSSFSNGKSGKSALLNQLSGSSANDYLQYASIAGELAGALKGKSFMPGWANQKDGILDQLKNAGSIADVAGGVGGILGLLSPGALTSGFKKNKSSVTSALNILSMIK